MVDVSKKNTVAVAAEVNLSKKSRNGGHMHKRKPYQLNVEDHQLVQQPSSRESHVSTDHPLSPRRREAEFHYPILEEKDGGVWLHLQLDDMDSLQFWTPRFRDLNSGAWIKHWGYHYMLFKDDQLGSYLLRDRRDGMRVLTHPTAHNLVRLPPILPYDPLQDFGVESFVVPRVLEYNHQRTENIEVNISVMDANNVEEDHSEGVQAQEDHQITVHENNGGVAVAQIEEDHQTTVNENNNVGMAVVMEDHQTMMINANNNVGDNLDVANEMIFPSLDDHNSFTLSSLPPWK